MSLSTHAPNRWRFGTDDGWLYVTTRPPAGPANLADRNRFVDPWPEPWLPMGTGAIALGGPNYADRTLFLAFARDERDDELIASRLRGLARTDPILGLGWESFGSSFRMVTGTVAIVPVTGPGQGRTFRAVEQPGWSVYMTGEVVNPNPNHFVKGLIVP